MTPWEQMKADRLEARKSSVERDSKLLTKSYRDIIKTQRVEVQLKPPEKPDDFTDTIIPVIANADSGVVRVKDDEDPSQEVIAEVCARYAWRFHKRCDGTGMLKDEICSCAAKRMKRRLEAGDD